jgi:hypothetical protein
MKKDVKESKQIIKALAERILALSLDEQLLKSQIGTVRIQALEIKGKLSQLEAELVAVQELFMSACQDYTRVILDSTEDKA